MADLTGGDELADAAGGDGFVAEGARGVDADGEAEFGAEGGEGVDAAFGLVAEAEVFAFVELGDVEGLLEDFGGEGAGGGAGELGGEGEDEDGIDAGGGEELDLAMQGGDEGLGGFGAEDAYGVGVEGDGDGTDAERAGSGDYFGDDPAVAGVDAIEVADGGYGGAEGGGDFGEGVEDFHSGDLEGELEAVVGEADIGGEDGFGGVVVEVVADVGEVGASGG